MKVDLARIRVGPGSMVRDAMTRMQDNGLGIALVLDEGGRLIATITDGDVRTAVLRDLSLDSPIEAILAQQRALGHEPPVVAQIGAPDGQLLELMRARGIRHVPLVDAGGRVCDLALLSDLTADGPVARAVVMAGGAGTRLRPLTDDLPKPMLPMGDRPIMEHIVRQLREAGIQRLAVTTHYKPEAIVSHFGSGERFGMDIEYLPEDEPLGTAGAIGRMEGDAPILVINGDIVTRLDFRQLVAYHQDEHADMTVGVRVLDLRVEYGVVETDGNVVLAVNEKPRLRLLVNAGIYFLEPAVRSFIPAGRRYDMTELIARLIAEGRRVISFPIHEYWLDVGRPGDYRRAIAELSADGR